ncbi:MAG: (4Fe-4S)-binding protein [Deltaproteobacteria bacterium]|nr:MAG: (4Fe-4S)-binding protein [Deltaproteobacteria bacterium]
MTDKVFVYKNLSGVKAHVDLDRCDGCAFCIGVCPFKAISLITASPMVRHIKINEKLCRGCGICQGTCPKQGVFVQGFSMDDLSRKIGRLLAA